MTDEFLGLRKVAKQADALGLRVPLTAQLALALFDRVEKAEQAIARVREQHQVDEYTAGHTIVRCVCEEMWPCSTVVALGLNEGENDDRV